MWSIYFLLASMMGACGTTSGKPSAKVENQRKAMITDVPNGTCPWYKSNEQPPAGVDYHYYLDDSLFDSIDSLKRDACRTLLVKKEARLCGAYFWFQLATGLYPLGEDWVAKQHYYRRAVESILDLVFDSQDIGELWYPTFTEENLLATCVDLTEPTSPFPVDLVQYYRGLKVQAVELYRKVAENYQYSLTAAADASRSLAGTTAAYSEKVWGSADDGNLSFAEVEGFRGLATAFLVGADVAFLDRLAARDFEPSDTTVAEQCGWIQGSPGGYQADGVDCDSRMLVPLAPCQHSIRSRPASNALVLLRQYGVPLRDAAHHNTDGAELAGFLLGALNRLRAAQGEVPLGDPTEMLAQYQIDEAALAEASAYLEEEAAFKLYPLIKLNDDYTGSDYLLGYATAGADVQRIRTMGLVNAARLGNEDSDIPLYKNVATCPTGAGTCLEFPTIEYNYHKHAYFKAMSHIRSMARRETEADYWATVFPNAISSPGLEAANTPYEKIAKLVDDEIGQDEIFYTITLLEHDINQQVFHYKRYQVDLAVPEAILPASLQQPFEVVSGRILNPQNQPIKAPAGPMNGLRCKLFGTVGSELCAPADYAVTVHAGASPMGPSPPCQAGFRCFYFEYETFDVVPPLDRDPDAAHPVFLYLGGQLVDSIYFEYGRTFFGWSGPTMDGYETHRLRSQIALPATDRVEKVLKRSDEQCSEAEYNALGLGNGLVPPLENELTANTNQYEDSFQYYLTKARDAASFAESKINAANASIGLEINYENEVDAIRAKAANAVEQICGEGRESCTTVKRDYRLDELWMMPELEIDFDCCPTESYNLWCYDEMPSPPEIVTVSDIIHVGNWLRCHNRSWFSSFAQSYYLHDLPVVIKDDPYLVDGTIYQLYEGDFLSALLDVNNALIGFLKNIDKVVLLQDTLGSEVGAIVDVINAKQAELRAAEMAKINNLLKGITESVFGFALFFSAPSKNATSGAGGAKALLGLAGQATADGIQEEVRQYQVDASIKDALIKLTTRVSDSRLLYDTLRQDLIRIDQSILKVKSLEVKADQALSDGERQELAQLEKLVGVRCEGETARCLKRYRRLFNLKHEQALEALRRAQRLAFMAKRALEFKLGLDFTRENAPGVIADAPVQWQDELFTLFSNQELYDPNNASSYVRKLEDFLFGYPFDHPFADEDDVAIISLRDDVLAVREQTLCQVPILSSTSSGDVDNYVERSEEIDTWEPDPSLPFSVDRDIANSPTSPPETTAERVTAPDSPGGGQSTFRLSSPEVFYDGGAAGFVDPTFTVNASIYARAVQGQKTVTLAIVRRAYTRGTYQFLDEVAMALPPVSVSQAGSWFRVNGPLTFDSPVDDEYVTLSLRVEGTGSVFLWGAQLTVDGALLDYVRNPRFEIAEGCELLSWQDPITGLPRSGYFPTVEDQTKRFHGAFRVKCASEDSLIPSDDLTICGASENLEYFETDFTIAHEEILAGKLLKQGQFAVGNYNYRIADLALNLVGRPNAGELDPSIIYLPVKDCASDPSAGTSCALNNFIPFDLTHAGSVLVLDYESKENRFTMDTGVVHYAKAVVNRDAPLANPIAASDLSLLGPYTKSEFRGRPIHGTYTLRIWNVPGLAWQNLADVQIYLKYRYWSAFANP
jgi:hypothetical protein